MGGSEGRCHDDDTDPHCHPHNNSVILSLTMSFPHSKCASKRSQKRKPSSDTQSAKRLRPNKDSKDALAPTLEFDSYTLTLTLILLLNTGNLLAHADMSWASNTAHNGNAMIACAHMISQECRHMSQTVDAVSC